MRPGTPGFVAERLIEAREARGLSAAALADMIGVKPQMVSYYEHRKNTPGPEVLTKLCERLGMPTRFFLAPPSERAEQSAFFFRSMNAAGATERKRVVVQLQWLRDLTACVIEKVELPRLNLPIHMDVPSEVTSISNEFIEDLATRVRRHWGMGDGPISNVAWLLENNGVLLSRMSLTLDKLDGVSAWFDDRPYMILNSDKESAARSRFDAAHELGHVLLHRHVDQTKFNNTKVFKLIETQAHRFASAFLLPARAFALEVHPLTLDHLVELKQRWKLSVALMIHRAADLDILTDRSAELMWRRYAFKHWRTCEPLDDELPVERPRMLQRAVDMMIRGGACTRDELFGKVPLSASDVERLAGLPTNYFNEEPADAIDLQPRLRSNAGGQPTMGAQVLPFRPRNNSSIGGP